MELINLSNKFWILKSDLKWLLNWEITIWLYNKTWVPIKSIQEFINWEECIAFAQFLWMTTIELFQLREYLWREKAIWFVLWLIYKK